MEKKKFYVVEMWKVNIKFKRDTQIFREEIFSKVTLDLID